MSMKIIRIPYHRRHMRGSGLGGLFSKLTTFVKPLLKSAFQAAKPLAKQTLKEIGKHGLHAASSTINDALTGDMTLKEAARKNIKKGWKRAKKTGVRGAKQAARASADEVMKHIKRKQTGSGKVAKAKKKKGQNKKKKKQTSRRGFRGIFQ